MSFHQSNCIFLSVVQPSPSHYPKTLLTSPSPLGYPMATLSFYIYLFFKLLLSFPLNYCLFCLFKFNNSNYLSSSSKLSNHSNNQLHYNYNQCSYPTLNSKLESLILVLIIIKKIYDMFNFSICFQYLLYRLDFSLKSVR